MNKSLIIMCTFFFSATLPMGPGCIRQNSNEIIRDLLFMHIERGDLRVVLDLLDAHSIQLTNLSGTTVIEALLAAKKVHGLDIGPVLKKVETLKMQNKDAT